MLQWLAGLTTSEGRGPKPTIGISSTAAVSLNIGGVAGTPRLYNQVKLVRVELLGTSDLPLQFGSRVGPATGLSQRLLTMFNSFVRQLIVLVSATVLVACTDSTPIARQGASIDPMGDALTAYKRGRNSPALVPMKQQGGTFAVPVLINNALTLDFTVDSASADVSIPADVVMTLVRTGTVSEADFIGDQTFILADGTRVKSQTFRIRSLQVGDRVVENVVGSIASVRGSLLLGQTFLGRFKSWSIDNAKHALGLE
jgi:predicted aspartyl protease